MVLMVLVVLMILTHGINDVVASAQVGIGHVHENGLLNTPCKVVTWVRRTRFCEDYFEERILLKNVAEFNNSARFDAHFLRGFAGADFNDFSLCNSLAHDHGYARFLGEKLEVMAR